MCYFTKVTIELADWDVLLVFKLVRLKRRMHLFLKGLFALIFRRVYALVALSIFHDFDWVVRICVTVDLAEGNL